MSIAEGFPGQRLLVLPRPTVAAARLRPATSHVLVTDCGYFPEARAHGRQRISGIDRAIVIACTQGRGWCVIGGVEHTVAAGQVLIIPPAVAHSYGADPDDPWPLWWMHVTGNDLTELLALTATSVASPVRGVSNIYRIATLLEEITDHLSQDSTEEHLVAASGAAWHLLASIAADHPPAGGRSSSIERARDYVRANIAESVTVAGLAAAASLSPSHFAALFRQQVGLPVLQYQTQLRMARARQLLDTTDRDVAQIAHELGYADSFYFSRLFRKVHGVPPRAYRAQHKG